MPNDYKHTDDNDLLIEGGDFVVGESTFQHQNILLLQKKGELRRFPKTGVGVDEFLQDDDPGNIYPEIQKQFEADKMVIRKAVVTFNESTGQLKTDIDAYYP